MKIPKTRNKYCPTCKKHTEHKVTHVKVKGMFSARPLSRHNKTTRVKWRGKLGFGNHGKYSKPALTKSKMFGKKTSKKTDFRFQCGVCKKMHAQKYGIRAKKVEFV